MARKPEVQENVQEPWFRKQTWSWYVELDGGRQYRLGKHPSEIAPIKGKRGWNPPAEIRAVWHGVMRDGGYQLPAKNPTLPLLFDDFLDHAYRTTKRETSDWYRIFLQDFKDHFPALKPSDVTESHVQRWLKADRKRPWGASTQRSAITILKRAFNWAVKSRRLVENPIQHMGRPPAQRREKILTAEERGSILAFFPQGDPFRDFLIAMQESGARPGEIMRLTAADVDLTGGTATLSEHKSRGKTARSRVIYLTPTLASMIAELTERHPAGPLFRNADGNAWNRQAVNCRFRRKRNRERDPLDRSINAYTYRHTYVTDALEKGVPPATVAELVGHTGLQTLAAHYAHMSEKRQHLRDAAKKAVE